MKKISYLFVCLFIAVGFSACSDDDEDASILIGSWKTVEDVQIEVRSNNEAVSELIKKEVHRLYEDCEMDFEENGEFQHRVYTNKTQIAMSTGKYYREDGQLYGQFPFQLNLGVSVVFLYVTESDPDHMTMSLNAVNHFKKKETLMMIGVEDPTGVEVSSVRVVFAYQRQ